MSHEDFRRKALHLKEFIRKSQRNRPIIQAHRTTRVVRLLHAHPCPQVEQNNWSNVQDHTIDLK